MEFFKECLLRGIFYITLLRGIHNHTFYVTVLRGIFYITLSKHLLYEMSSKAVALSFVPDQIFTCRAGSD